MKYKGKNLREIKFPLGGIGTGCVNICGNGRMCDFEIFDRPDKGGLNGYTHFAVKAHTGGKKFVKVLQGDYDGSFMGEYRRIPYAGYGFGPPAETMAGFPHFKNVTFDGKFPIAELKFSDAEFPGRITLTAFNPLIPYDSYNSGLPAAFFEIEYENDTDDAIEFTSAFSVRNPFGASLNESISGRYQGAGLINAAANDIDAPDYGNLSVMTDCENACVQKYWYRGGWQDGIVTFFREFSEKESLSDREYEAPGKNDCCSVCGTIIAGPHEKKTIKFVLSWYSPNRGNYWEDVRDATGKYITWKNYYATLFSSSEEVAKYCLENFGALKEKTEKFVLSVAHSSLCTVFKDAALSNLATLHSPVVMRLEDGGFYGWEGSLEQAGSCEGSCQHVWNYAYALCFLFPDLERSMRDLEIKYCLRKDGGTAFRIKLPLYRNPWDFRSCVDGHMGTIAKIYREWKLSGDDEWLKGKWSAVKKMLDFATSPENADLWDEKGEGVIVGRQHHTLDMELFGANSWLQGFYLLALKAGAEIADYLGDRAAFTKYTALFEKGRKFLNEKLFNGEYFVQKINLKDKSITDKFGCSDVYYNDEAGEIKYQIGEGCEIDQLCAQWHAALTGIGEIFETEKAKTALCSMLKYNYKPSMRSFVNPWRVFALNDEAGTVMCEYPTGSVKPAVPLPYCEECMTGFEYEFAALLSIYGMPEESKKIVRSVRNRYDGSNRNPFGEIECGSNYARSMASWSLIPVSSGFYFDIPHKTIGFNPVQDGEFCCPWSVGGAYGLFERKTNGDVKIKIIFGKISLEKIKLPFVKIVKSLAIDGKKTGFVFGEGTLGFDATDIERGITIKTTGA